MSQEEVIVEGSPTYIVALCDDLDDRLDRANYTYTSARRPPLPRARPFLVGNATLTPLFDRSWGRTISSRAATTRDSFGAAHPRCRPVSDRHCGFRGGAPDRERTYDLKPGMVVWIPANTAHIHAATRNEPLEFIFITATGHTSDIVE